MTDPRIDRLYQLLPAIYRMRDAEQKYPLQALLRVVAEQVNVIEDDIKQLYENWFIETADDWAVPYIADLIGYRAVPSAGIDTGASAEGRMLNKLLIARREVANTIRYRRGKGRLSTLEQLSVDVSGWPVHAVEFFKLLGWNQNIDHPHPARARTVNIRNSNQLDLLDGPFDHFAHTADVRRVDSTRTQGRYNIPSVGVFVWRLNSYSVTHSAAYCAENAGPHCMTFSVLGQCAPLFIAPLPRTEECHPGREINYPAMIRRRGFDENAGLYYGAGKSITIWADGWAGFDADLPIPVSAIIPADLTDWTYAPPLKHIAVDPLLGRFTFPPGQLPRKGVRVSYHHGFSAPIGGGEYPRQLTEPINPLFYRIGKGQPYQKIGDAVRQWVQDSPANAVIEFTDSSVYVEPLSINLGAHKALQIRAASGARPVLRLLDWQTDLPDALSIGMDEGSRFTLDGLLITGRAVQVTGPSTDGTPSDQRTGVCGAELVIRHCTLVPGWGIDCDCEPKRPAEASLELYSVRAKVRIEHSILGSIQVFEDEVRTDPIPIRISDSILDSTNALTQALGGPGASIASAVLTFKRCTVFGIVDVHAIELAENSIFYHCVNVARRQLGCMRFCYVPVGCRTPRRYHCQPDLVVQPLTDQALVAAEKIRVRPQFTSTRYGNPGYAQLGLDCSEEIKRGADDESEMGVFHDLFQPQREGNLIVRLAEFTPAGMDAGIIWAN